MASAGFDMNELRLNLKNMDYINGPGSTPSSGRFNHSSRSTTKSILRGQVGSPKQGSPSSGRSVRFTDSNVINTAVELFPKLHINEATQTNGELEDEYELEPILRPHLNEATQTNYDHEDDNDLEMFTQLHVNEATQTGDNSRENYNAEPSATVKATQTELQQPERITTGIRHFTKHKPLSALSRGNQAKRDANLPTVMPQAQNDGHKIVQNFELTVPKNNPKKTNNNETIDDGKRIVQNMALGPRIKSVAVQTVDIPDGNKIIRNLEVARPNNRVHLNENWDELMDGIPSLSVSSPRNRHMLVQYESPRGIIAPKLDNDQRHTKKEPVLIYNAENITPRSDTSTRKVDAGLELNLCKEVVDDIVSPRQAVFSAPNSARAVPKRQPHLKKSLSAASSPRSKISLSSSRSSGESIGSKLKLTDFLKRQTFKYSSLHQPYKHVSSVTRTNLQEPEEEKDAACQTPKSGHLYGVNERATDTELDIITDAEALAMKETIAKLKMTNVETHSFVPISKPEDSDTSSKHKRGTKEHQARNTFIKGVNLGPSPTEDLLSSTGKQLEEYLKPSIATHNELGVSLKTTEPMKHKVAVVGKNVTENGIAQKTSQQTKIPHASNLKCVCGPTNFQRTTSAASYIASRPANCAICNTLTPNLAQLRNKAIRKSMTSIGSDSTGDDDSSMLSSPRNASMGGYVLHNTSPRETNSSPFRMSRPRERTFGRPTREYTDGTRSISPRDVSAERGPTNTEYLEAQTHVSNVKPGPKLESESNTNMFSPKQLGIDIMSPRRNVSRSRSRSPRGLSPRYSPPRKQGTFQSSYNTNVPNKPFSDTAYDHMDFEKSYQTHSLNAKPPLPANTRTYAANSTHSRLDTLQRRPSPHSRRSVGGRPEYSSNLSVSMRPKVEGFNSMTFPAETHDIMRSAGVGIENGRKSESATGNKVTIGKAPKGIADTDCVFLDEDTIQKIIEEADL